MRLRNVFHGTFLGVRYMIGTAPCDIMSAGGVDAALEFAAALTADDFSGKGVSVQVFIALPFHAFFLAALFSDHLGGLKITIDLKRSTDPEALMTKLFKLTSLESTFSCNFNLLINGTPRTLGIRGIIAEWISFRRVCVKRENTYELQRKQERLRWYCAPQRAACKPTP